MKKIKKFLPTVVYTFLFLLIVFLTFAVFERKSPLPSDASGITVIDLNDNNDSPLPNSESIPDNPEENADDKSDLPNETTTETKIYDDVVPRLSSGDNRLQKIYGNGKIKLENVLPVQDGYYTVVSSEAESGDVASSSFCVGIVKSDFQNNLLSVCPVFENETYLFSQLSPCGIVVIDENNAKKSVVRIVSYDFKEYDSFQIETPAHTTVAPIKNGFLLFASYEKESVVFAYSDGVMTFRALDRGMIIDYFEYEDFFRVFFTSDSGWFSLDVNKSNATTSGKKIYSTETSLLFISPRQNGFLTVEQKENVVFAGVYQTNNRSEKISLGSLDVRAIRSDGENIYLVCDKTVVIDSSLHALQTTDDASFDVLSDIVQTKDGFRFIARTPDAKNVFVTQKGGKLSVSPLPFSSSVFYLVYTHDETFVCVYQNGEYVEAIEIIATSE